MGGPDRSGFRITVRRGAPVDVPPVRVPIVRLEKGEEVPLLKFFDPIDEVELPDELYLRNLPGLDLDDPDAIKAFIAHYGMLWKPEWDAWDSALVAANSDLFSAGRSLGSRHAATVDEFRLYARLLRAMVKHWDAHTSARGAPAIRKAWTSETFGSPSGRMTEGHCWRYFAGALNAGLAGFHARVEIAGPDLASRTGEPHPSTYEALCLQLLNHIDEGATYRRCRNETCATLFVRQQGRSVRDQGRDQRRTTGVEFCTWACTKAQTQREYRRRKSEGVGR